MMTLRRVPNTIRGTLLRVAMVVMVLATLISARPAAKTLDAPQSGSPECTVVDLTPIGGKQGSPRKIEVTEAADRVRRISITIDDGSWIRLKSHGEDGYGSPKMSMAVAVQRVNTAAIVIVGNLDHAHIVPQGQTITRMAVQTTEGDVGFEIKAGIHMSEWNGPNKHVAAPTHIGDNRYMPVFWLSRPMVVTGLRFDYVEVSKDFDHMSNAPGFCLRGITLLQGESTGTGAVKEPADVTATTLQAATRTVAPGGAVEVPVWLIKAANMGSMNFSVKYDPRVVKLEGLPAPGNMLRRATPSVNPDEPGVVRFGFVDNAGMTGTDTVLLLPFRAVGGVKDRSLLTLDVTYAALPGNQHVSVAKIDGAVEIAGAGSDRPDLPKQLDPPIPPDSKKTDPPILTIPTEPKKPEPPVLPTPLLGDCDGDGVLKASDALCALHMSTGKITPVRLIMDVDRDTFVTAGDAGLILKKVVGR